MNKKDFNSFEDVPLCSILMPVFNESKFIIPCINSVLSQSEKRFELIIVDDGSTDNTFELIKNTFHDQRIKILRSHRMGKNNALNIAFSVSKGNWIILLAGDDLIPKNSIKDRLEYLKNFDPCIDKIIGKARLITISQNSKFNKIIIPKKKSKGNSSGGTIIFSRNLANVIFPLPIDLPNEDLWINLVSECFAEKIINIPIITLLYRVHSENSFRRTENFLEMNEIFHERALVYEKFKEKYYSLLNKSQLNRIKFLSKAEEYRYKGQLSRLMFLSNISIKERLRFMCFSNPLLFKIRMRFYNFFSGW